MNYESKIIEDKSEGIILISEWNTQYCMAIIMRLIVNIPIKICCFCSMLKLPLNKEKIHPAENNASIIMDSWKPGTRKRYQSIWNKWLTFCTTRRKDSLYTDLGTVLEFSTERYEAGYRYNAFVQQEVPCLP